MKIEVGKYYRTRDGQKVGPMRKTPQSWGYNDLWIWTDRDKPPTDDQTGIWCADGFSHTLPIIAEWREPVDLTAITTPYGLLDAETHAALKAHGGPYEYFDGQHWSDTRSLSAPSLSHRVKPQPPKPREWWLTSQIAHPTEEKALTFLANLQDENPCMDFPQAVHVREVLE